MNYGEFPVLQNSIALSKNAIQMMRNSLAENTLPDNIVVTTFGSYARQEASALSDLDYGIFDKSDSDVCYEAGIESALIRIVPKGPSKTGAFGKARKIDELLNNIGGEHDTNESLTRRMLFILESEWLHNEDEFGKLRDNIVCRYVRATPKDHQMALFLLNDIIRYWRTMTVDYMYKTDECGKPWAIRNIKLVFSRKIMYAGGLFAAASTVDLSLDKKKQFLVEMCSMTPLERIAKVCGDNSVKRCFELYEFFLSKMQCPEVRQRLEAVSIDDHSDPVFRELKNKGHELTRELLLLIEKSFHRSHPIYRSLVF